MAKRRTTPELNLQKELPQVLSTDFNLFYKPDVAPVDKSVDAFTKSLDAFVSGAGTGGTIMGVRRAAVAARLQTQFVLVQPEEDAMSHGIQGINDGANFLAKPELMDRIIKVSTSDAKKRAERFAKNRGVLIGISAGANLLAAEKLFQNYKIPGAIVTMLCDRGERYLSQ